VATTDTTRWVDTPGARGTYHYVVVPRLTSGVGASRVSSAVVPDVVGSFPTDVTPPARPEALKAVASSTGVAVTWTSSSDDVGPVLYEVHRSAKNSFTPGPTTILGLTAASSYTDVAGTSGATYAVVAVDAAGNRSQLATTITGLG
jgi:cellulose 1,4-beta-cellobiosidase